MHINELFNLRGKTSIITGGYKGLGLQAATALAEAGSNIVICARNEAECKIQAEEIERKTGVQAMGARCNITSVDDVDRLIASILDQYGGIDVLVNNAGITWGEPPETMSLKSWEKVINVNLTGTFLITQRVARQMIDRGGGKIINISSIAGLRGLDYLNALAYSTSKGGMIAFTRDLAVSWARYNINVNVICPGFFQTDITKSFFDLEGKKQTILEKTPMRRIGGHYDLKGTVVFLASAASDYVSGSVIAVDGGYCAN